MNRCQVLVSHSTCAATPWYEQAAATLESAAAASAAAVAAGTSATEGGVAAPTAVTAPVATAGAAVGEPQAAQGLARSSSPALGLARSSSPAIPGLPRSSSGAFGSTADALAMLDTNTESATIASLWNFANKHRAVVNALVRTQPALLEGSLR